MYTHYGLLIDNAWKEAAGGASLAVHSPVTGQSVGDIPAASFQALSMRRP